MTRSEFAFATVKSVKPLTVQLDGDPTVIPAVAYGVTVKVKQRVEVRVRKAPQSPLIVRVLTAPKADAGSFVVMDRTSYAIVTVEGDLTETDSAELASFTFVAGTPGYALIDHGVSVDTDMYPDGSVFAVNALGQAGFTRDQLDARALVRVAGGVGGSYISLNIGAKENGTLALLSFADVDTCLAVVADGAISIGFNGIITATNVTDPAATWTAHAGVEILLNPVLVAAGTS